MKLKIEEYVDDENDPFWVEEIKTDKCDIKFEEWEIYRAGIVLPGGVIIVKFDGFKCKNWSGVSGALRTHGKYYAEKYDEEGLRPYSIRKFKLDYNEFDYGGPPVGYYLAIDYIDPIPKDEFKEWVKDWRDRPTYREYMKAVNYINDVLYKAGKIIIRLAKQYEKEIIKEMRRQEMEMTVRCTS